MVDSAFVLSLQSAKFRVIGIGSCVSVPIYIKL